MRSSLLSTVAIAGGRRQIVYAGHPLYTYVEDSAAGQTGYVGIMQFGGAWPALGAGGSLIR